jgi:hypothetical protein
MQFYFLLLVRQLDGHQIYTNLKVWAVRMLLRSDLIVFNRSVTPALREYLPGGNVNTNALIHCILFWYNYILVPCEICFFFRCENWSLALREECRFEKIGLWGRHVGVAARKQEAGENCIVRWFMICNSNKILVGDTFKEDEMRLACDVYGG